MRILIAGASAPIGKELIEKLIIGTEHQLNVLTKNKNSFELSKQFPLDVFEWNPRKNTLDPEALTDVDCVVNLSTANAHIIKDQINKLKSPPSKFIHVSCPSFDKETFEKGTKQEQFNGLTKECKLIALRAGFILTPKKIQYPTGPDDQLLYWIHLEDLIRSIQFLIERSPEQKIYHAATPNPLTNKVFREHVAKFIKRPFLLKASPQSSQDLSPNTLLDEGFEFTYPNLKAALKYVFEYKSRGESLLENYLWTPAPLEKVFSFFSSEKNLEVITPEYLNFKVKNKTTDEIKKGTIINYQLKLRGIPLRWKSLISEFDKDRRFIDEQLKGPYKKWVHLHEFKKHRSGTLIRDKVVYKVPFGSLGRLIAGKYVRRDVKTIFNHRNKVIRDIFLD